MSGLYATLQHDKQCTGHKRYACYLQSNQANLSATLLKEPNCLLLNAVVLVIAWLIRLLDCSHFNPAGRMLFCSAFDVCWYQTKGTAPSPDHFSCVSTVTESFHTLQWFDVCSR